MQAKASAQPAVRRRMAKRYATKAMPGQNEKAGVAGIHMRGNSPSVLAYVKHAVETFGACLSIPHERSPPCTR